MNAKTPSKKKLTMLLLLILKLWRRKNTKKIKGRLKIMEKLGRQTRTGRGRNKKNRRKRRMKRVTRNTSPHLKQRIRGHKKEK